LRAAIYSRFSGEHQRETSIDDQARNCRRRAERDGFEIVASFDDRAMSGAKADRPGYQAMLAAAVRREFEVLLVDDLSRLSRDEIEIKQVVRRFVFAGLRLIGVSDGFDSAAKGHKIQATVRGLMNELYLDDLAEKTHRGLAGQALRGFNTGGRSYGYRHLPIADGSGAAHREIDPAQAAIVLEIFQRFAAGASPRAIARELNRRRVPAPRGGSWAFSAIYGNRRSGVGILNNPLYAGRVIWNRSKWVRHPDTGRRARVERPPGEWIERQDDALRIVPVDLWEMAQERLARRRSRPGRAELQLLSGFLRCAVCGGAYVKTDRYRYGCATHKDRGPEICGNGMKIAVKAADEALLEGIRDGLPDDEALEEFKRETAALLRTEKRQGSQDAARARHATLEREITNMVAAIRAGAFSGRLQAELAAAEAELAALRAEAATQASLDDLPDFLPRAADLFRELLDDLPATLAEDPAAAREHIRTLLGDEIRLTPKPEAKIMEAQIRADGIFRMAANIAAGGKLDNVVAGASFDHYLTIVNIPASGRIYD
jgi:DNA invertase Pin-like site-specific DNA recombinase